MTKSQLTQADEIFVYVTRRTDHHLCIMSIVAILTCRSEVMCRLCILQNQPTQHALEHAVCVALIPQREVDHTDQRFICPERSIARAVGIHALRQLPRAVGIDDYPSDV